MDNQTPLNNRLNFAAFSAWLVSSLFMAVTALSWFGQDFRGYYAAARVVLAGGNPYDYHELAPMLLIVTGRMGNNPYYYAPWFAWSIIPLAWLPFEIARGVWMLINLSLWAFSLWQLSKLLKWPTKGWRRWLLYLLATFIFAWITWRYEQTGILIFALLLGVLLALRNEKSILAGVLLAILLIKPNITLIPVITISFWFILHRNWKPLISMIISILGLLIAASIVTPNWFRPFFEPGFSQGLVNVLDGPEQIVTSRINTTLHDWLAMFKFSPQITQSISVLVFILGLSILAIITWKSTSIIRIMVASLLVNFAITPYALQYDYPLLTLVLFWALALAQFGRKRWMGIVGSVLVLFITSVLFWEGPISDGYWIVLGLIGLAMLNWYNADKSQIPINTV